MSDLAVFDPKSYTVQPGWATYHGKHRGLRRLRIRCWFGRHIVPPEPEIANGYSSDNYDQCWRCFGFLKWFVIGQHRWGWAAKEG